MKTIIFISILIFSNIASATEYEPSYACKVMMERGSTMFCPNDIKLPNK